MKATTVALLLLGGVVVVVVLRAGSRVGGLRSLWATVETGASSLGRAVTPGPATTSTLRANKAEAAAYAAGRRTDAAHLKLPAGWS